MNIEKRLYSDWFLTLELSTGCNLSCPSCPQNVNNDLLIMDKSLLINVLNKICEENLKFSSLTPFFRGEPFYSPEFLIYLNLINNYNKNHFFYDFLTIHTNGTLLNYEICKKTLSILNSSGYGELYISVDAVTEETYQKVRPSKNKSLFGLIANIKNCLALCKEMNVLKNISIIIQFVSGKNNSHEYNSFIKYWTSYLNENKMEFDINLNCLNFREKPGIHIVKKISSDFDSQISSCRNYCVKPWISPIIGVDGKLTFCCSDFEFEFLNGSNIIDYDYSIKKFWSDNKMLKQVRKDFNNNKTTFDKCVKCINSKMNLESIYE